MLDLAHRLQAINSLARGVIVWIVSSLFWLSFLLIFLPLKALFLLGDEMTSSHQLTSIMISIPSHFIRAWGKLALSILGVKLSIEGTPPWAARETATTPRVIAIAKKSLVDPHFQRTVVDFRNDLHRSQ